MSGNLSLAVEWANKSSKTRPSKAAGYYLEILNEQIKLQQKKKNKMRSFLWISILLVLCHSCHSVKTIGIEISVQQDIPISDSIQRIAILNRSMSEQFTNLSNDSLEKLVLSKQGTVNFLFMDSAVADTVIQNTAMTLFESGRYDVVVPRVRNVFRPENDVNIQPLDSFFIAGICEDFKVDAVLVLEYFREQFSSTYSPLMPPDHVIRWNDSISQLVRFRDYQVRYHAEWRLYSPARKVPLNKYQRTDVMMWNNWHYSTEHLYLRESQVKSKLFDCGIKAGIQMADEICPKWRGESRSYYKTGKIKIDSAIPLIKLNKWEDAEKIWSEHVNCKSTHLKSKLEFNLALAAEMNGKLELAIEWIGKSLKNRKTNISELYLRILEKRLIENQIKKQV